MLQRRHSALKQLCLDVWSPNSAPGAAYVVILDGEIVETGTYGVADFESGARVTNATPFRVASLTKPLAGAIAAKLAHEGRLDLDAALLNTSAIYADECDRRKRYFQTQGWPFLDKIEYGSDAIKLRHVISHLSNTPVGAAFSYNGFLYGLLSAPIGSAFLRDAQDGLRAAMRAMVIEPLGLKNAAAGIGDPEGADIIARLAMPHQRVGGEWHRREAISDDINAGAGFVASAQDMATISTRLRSEIIGNDNVWESLITPAVLRDGSAVPYAKGWFVYDHHGETVLWHYGLQEDAYSALWFRFEARDAALIMLTNSDDLTRPYPLLKADPSVHPIFNAFAQWSAHKTGEKD